MKHRFSFRLLILNNFFANVAYEESQPKTGAPYLSHR